MPLPNHPFTINGGCNCASIRYRVNVPAFEDRVVSVYCDDEARSDGRRFPHVLIDHCNDCRRATASIVPIWFISVIENVEMSTKKPSTEDPGSRVWVGAREIIGKEEAGSSNDSTLIWYNSSEDRFRGFCGKCGTMLWLRSTGLPAEWPEMIDILLGTVDREDLEKGWLKPDREIWWEKGIPWIQEFIRHGTAKEDLPRHPLWKMNHNIES